MTKIPVGATMARAYHFLLDNLLSIAGILWLPWLLIMACTIPLMRLVTEIMNAAIANDLSAIGHSFVILVPIYLAMIILLCVQMVGVAEFALGLRKGPQYYYFSLGKPVWRLIASILLFSLMMMGIMLISIVIGVVVGIAGGMIAGLAGAGKFVTGLGATAEIIVMYGFLAYFVTRFAFLLLPVVVAENRIGIKRAWKLSKGNFWRMFAIILCILIPLIILELAILFGFGMPPMAPLNATAEQMAAAQQAILVWDRDLISRMMHYWYLIYPLGALFTLFIYGSIATVQVFAYRALVPEGTALPED